MIRSLFTWVFLVVVGLALTSCTTCKHSAQNNARFHCIVQSATDEMVTYEIRLDDKLISSGRTIPKEKATQMLEFAAAPGEHVLTVIAPGCETWQKTINIMDSARFGQSFLVELKKLTK